MSYFSSLSSLKYSPVEPVNNLTGTAFPSIFCQLLSSLTFCFFSLAPFAKKPEDVERYNVPGMCFCLLFQYQNEKISIEVINWRFIFLLVAPDRFLPPSSPLTDIETIFGGNQTVAFHVRRFDKHVSEDHFDSWESLSWVHYEW